VLFIIDQLIHERRPVRWVNQKWTTMDGKALNRTYISEDFVQILCVSESKDTLPRPRSSGLQNMLRFGRFCSIRSGRPWTDIPNERCWTRERGVSKKSVFARKSLMEDPLGP